MMDWKDEIRKTIFRQLPKSEAADLDFEDSVKLHKQSGKQEAPIWEKTVKAIDQEFELTGEELASAFTAMTGVLTEPFETSPKTETAESEDDKEERVVLDKPYTGTQDAVAEIFSQTKEPDIAPKKSPDQDRSNDMKQWLFKENMRLEGLRSEISKASQMLKEEAALIKEQEKQLEEDKKKFALEKEEFNKEMKDWSSKITQSQKKLNQDRTLFDQKYKVLEMGFAKLGEDRKQFEAQKRAFEARKQFYKDAETFASAEIDNFTGEYIFFKGVHNPLAVKKRYKELIKIYHPDNTDGDKYILQRINQEYDRIRKSMF